MSESLLERINRNTLIDPNIYEHHPPHQSYQSHQRSKNNNF